MTIAIAPWAPALALASPIAVGGSIAAFAIGRTIIPIEPSGSIASLTAIAVGRAIAPVKPGRSISPIAIGRPITAFAIGGAIASVKPGGSITPFAIARLAKFALDRKLRTKFFGPSFAPFTPAKTAIAPIPTARSLVTAPTTVKGFLAEGAIAKLALAKGLFPKRFIAKGLVTKVATTSAALTQLAIAMARPRGIPAPAKLRWPIAAGERLFHLFGKCWAIPISMAKVGAAIAIKGAPPITTTATIAPTLPVIPAGPIVTALTRCILGAIAPTFIAVVVATLVAATAIVAVAAVVAFFRLTLLPLRSSLPALTRSIKFFARFFAKLTKPAGLT
jgi:hypothetical protein